VLASKGLVERKRFGRGLHAERYVKAKTRNNVCRSVRMNEHPASRLGRPAVTVVIPTFNRAAIVGRAIRSVLAQTCQDWELIVVDDYSTDGTEQAVGSFSDRRIEYVRHDRNRGGGAARNTGIRRARGDYVAFLDSDDEWLPEKLEKDLEVFRKSDHELGFVYTGKMILEESGKLLRVRMPTLCGWVYEAMLEVNFVGSCSRVTAKKQVLDRVAGFDEMLPNGQDYDLWLRVARVSKIGCVPHCLVKRYVLAERMSVHLRGICEGWERILMKYRGDMKSRTLTKHLSRVAILLFNYDRRRGRALAWEALRLQPLQPGLFAALALSTLGIDYYRWVFGRVIKLIDKDYLGRAKI